MTDQLFTWGALAALSGGSLLTFLFVQITKNLIDRVYKFPTDLYAVLVGFFWILIANIALGANPSDWRTYLLNFANAFLVALSAGKMHDLVLSAPGAKQEQTPPTSPVDSTQIQPVGQPTAGTVPATAQGGQQFVPEAEPAPATRMADPAAAPMNQQG